MPDETSQGRSAGDPCDWHRRFVVQGVNKPPSLRSNKSSKRSAFSLDIPRPMSAPGYQYHVKSHRESIERTRDTAYHDQGYGGSQANIGKVEGLENNQGDDEFDEDLDIVEFRLEHEAGIMRAGDDPSKAPDVIRYLGPKDSPGLSSEESRMSVQVERPVFMSSASNLSSNSLANSLDTATISRGSASFETKERGFVKSPARRKSSKISESSHQAVLEPEAKAGHEILSSQILDEENNSDNEWQDMKTVGSYEVYDDKGRVVIHKNLKDEDVGEINGHISAAKGYTRLALDDDAKSVTSLDENTAYLFEEDDLSRNPIAQLQMTKELLTDSQRIAYVGLCRLVMNEMAKELAIIKATRKVASGLSNAQGSVAMWTQKIMNRLYLHMDLSPEEQMMIEQLSLHGVLPDDLAPSLKDSATVKNPMSEREVYEGIPEPKLKPAVGELNENPEDFNIKRPEDLKDQDTIDIDIRWTVLCDLFLVLLSDSVYDSRSRTLLEKIAGVLKITKLEIAQFEKKVSDAMEIEEGSAQTWNEKEIMEERRKAALKKKYMYIGLATLGGGLVIGLSAGLLAPVIGTGLAAGFTTIGVTGTSGFLAGAGGAAIVTTTGAAVGARIGSKGMSRRMGHVRTFEFRPLHNNKRVNLIITVSGWMSGKEDDVRLPFSTVDPIMGDLFSVLWEPEMLQSMGQTINILATEVLTQSVQQLLGQTVLVALMASLQLPMALSKLGYLLDNPWNVSLDRAWASGLILADALISRNMGGRPATLVGFSLGARVIYSCLVELSRRGAYGLVQDVYIFGAPVVFKKDQLILARTVVSGRFVNGYSRKDWILGYLFRATSGGLGRIFGLAPIEAGVEIENFDNTEYVEGHMGYRKAIPSLLSALGWEVLSEEFTEIEDPDPEGHRERQRELIMEFDEARKQMEEEVAKRKVQQKKSRFFSWMKPKRKEWWDMADRQAAGEMETQHKKEEGAEEETSEEYSLDDREGKIMFDVDAIKQEVKNIEVDRSTLKGNDLPSEVPLSKVLEKRDEVVDNLEITHDGPANSENIHMSFDDGMDDVYEDDEYERRGSHAPPEEATVQVSPVAEYNVEYSEEEYPEEEQVTMTFE